MSSLNHFSPIQTTTPLTETPFLTENALNPRQVLLKFVLIGDASTGKTSIINKFLKNEFSSTYTPTSTNNYNPSSEEIIINCNDDEIDKKYIIQLQLWDTSGIFPSNCNIPSTIKESSLKSKKHPKSSPNNTYNLNPTKSDTNNNTLNNNNNIRNNFSDCVQSKPFLPNNEFILSDHCDEMHIMNNELDLPLVFDEIDAKDAIEELLNHKPSQTQMINHHEMKNNSNNKDGYSSSSSMDHSIIDDNIIELQEQILLGKQTRIENTYPLSTKRVFDELIFSSLDALILVYDITNKQSLLHLNSWLELFAQNTINSSDIPILVLGNKNDLVMEGNDTISNYARQGKIFTQQLGNPLKLFKSISAMNNTQNHIKSIFIQLARMCINTQSSILQLTSCDSISSLEHINDKKTTYKRIQRSNDFFVKTCAHNFCSKPAQDDNDHTFCVIL